MQDALEEALRLDARKKIYEIIKSNPGLHFRELQRRSGLATGALQYHLLVRERFDDVKLMSLLRQDSIRGIVVFLMGKRSAVFETIVKNSGLSSSTVSWHLEKLVEFQIVQKYVSGKKTFYKIVDKDRVASILVGYKESFLDSVVDNFVEVWEKL